LRFFCHNVSCFYILLNLSGLVSKLTLKDNK
jgi:hypothetical protein